MICVSGGMDAVFSIVQSFLDVSPSGWCFFTLEDSVYGIMLRKVSSTIYRWQGMFIPLEVNISHFIVHKIKCTCKLQMTHELLLFLIS